MFSEPTEPSKIKSKRLYKMFKSELIFYFPRFKCNIILHIILQSSPKGKKKYIVK